VDVQEKTVRISAEIPESLFNQVVELANLRKVSANTVLEHALQTELYLASKESAGGSLLIQEGSGGIKKVKRF
jgi:hypothetical protein